LTQDNLSTRMLLRYSADRILELICGTCKVCHIVCHFLELKTSNFCCLELEDTALEAERRHHLYFDANTLEEGQNTVRFLVRLVIAKGNNIFWKTGRFYVCILVHR
jgi:acetyl-CoA carboxylase beta subunit